MPVSAAAKCVAVAIFLGIDSQTAVHPRRAVDIVFSMLCCQRRNFVLGFGTLRRVGIVSQAVHVFAMLLKVYERCILIGLVLGPHALGACLRGPASAEERIPSGCWDDDPRPGGRLHLWARFGFQFKEQA